MRSYADEILCISNFLMCICQDNIILVGSFTVSSEQNDETKIAKAVLSFPGNVIIFFFLLQIVKMGLRMTISVEHVHFFFIIIAVSFAQTQSDESYVNFVS